VSTSTDTSVSTDTNVSTPVSTGSDGFGPSPTAGSQTEALLAELVSRAGRENPYPVYAALRSAAPLARMADGALLLTRFADCAASLRDPNIGHGHPDGGYVVDLPTWRDHLSLSQFRTSMLSMDPPAHTRLRGLVSGAFTPRRVAELRPFIESTTARLLDDLPSDVGADFISVFAFPLPIAVIGELLGVPQVDQGQFQHLARDWTHVLDVTTPRIVARADAAAAEIRGYLAELARDRRRRPQADLLSALLLGESDDRLSDDELLTMAALLFAAGFETATHLLGNGLVALAAHPEQRELLRRTPELAPNAVEELIRFDSSVQVARRVVLRDTVIAGEPVLAGQRIVVCLGAANHDPARFAHPGRLDLGRPDGGSMSFGGGIHYCLGAPLARLEGQVAFPALLRRFPRLTIQEPLHRRASLTVRGFLRIPMITQ
jgi:cytochrome P450